MKVFLFSREYIDKNENCFKQIELGKKHKVKDIVINNPEENNELYILHSFDLINNNKSMYKSIDKVRVLSSEKFDKEFCIQKDNVNIYLNEYISNKTHLELKEINLKEVVDSDVIEILENDFAIILPGGDFIIRLCEEVEELNASIKLQTVKIY